MGRGTGTRSTLALREAPPQVFALPFRNSLGSLVITTTSQDALLEVVGLSLATYQSLGVTRLVSHMANLQNVARYFDSLRRLRYVSSPEGNLFFVQGNIAFRSNGPHAFIVQYVVPGSSTFDIVDLGWASPAALLAFCDTAAAAGLTFSAN